MQNDKPPLREGNITIEFEGEILKYDECQFYRDKVEKCKGQEKEGGKEIGTKAMDILAVNKEKFYFLEIKDFRTSEKENKNRIQYSFLAVEFAIKLRDTLAGLSGAYLSENEELSHFSECLFSNSEKRKLEAILLIEGNFYKNETRRKLYEETLGNLLTKMTSLTRFIRITLKVGNMEFLNKKTSFLFRNSYPQ